MKFAFISTMYGSPWGGSEELWCQAAIQLKRAGHDVRASVGYWPQLSNKVTALVDCGIKLETHPSGHSGFARQIWKKLLRANARNYDRLKRFNPDLVVISQGHNAGGFGWAKVCRSAAIPYVIVVQCNSYVWWFDADSIGEAVSCYTGARRIFCVSQSNLDLLRLQLAEPLPNGEVARNPVNVSIGRAHVWPDEVGIWRLACVARMDPSAKGQDLLLQTLARPEWRDRPVELNFYGEGSYELGLRRMAEALQLKNVHFRGHVNDIESIWQHNHLLVLPSRYEGLPLALVEAMACGRPAAVTDVGGNAELCIDDETGFVAPAATLSSVSHMLERAWEQRERWPHMGQAARARIENWLPNDPVGVFCEQLKTTVASKSEATAG
jgi:glycosyltransferase involved in cell wall biosynthesis